MVGVELCERIVELSPFALGPRLLGKLVRRLNQDPASKRASREYQTTPSARPAHDPPPRRIEGSGAADGWHLPAMNTSVERRREAENREDPNLETQQGLFRWGPIVESGEKAYGRVEHGRLGLVVGYALPNDRHGGACGSNRLETAKDLVERSVDRNLLQVCQLTASRTELRLHQDVGL